MSSIIEGYSYDIFISYRQKDNKYDGWVTEFVDNLKRELEATFKEEVSVYFDLNPHDGLLETHDVDASLKDKLKALVFIPIISRTYCDPKSFAWGHEFKVFIEQASEDQFGLKVTLPGGNVANRVLPIRINDLDTSDTKLCESILGGVLRGVDFIYKEPGVNRPLRSNEDNPHDNLNHTNYRNQINKVALAVKDIIESMKTSITLKRTQDKEIQIEDSERNKLTRIIEPVQKKDKKLEPKAIIKRSRKEKSGIFFYKVPILILVSIILIIGIICIKVFNDRKKKQQARYVLIPEIQKLVEENFTPPFRAFDLASEAEKYIPNDSSLVKLWPRISGSVSLQTRPEGAKVSYKDYNQPAGSWKEAGVTPLSNVRIPLGYKRIIIEKDGFQTIYITRFSLFDLTQPVKLDSIGILPTNMVRIPTQKTALYIVGIVRFGDKHVCEFLADRFEVTNKEYKKFMDANGYGNKDFWRHPIYLEGKEISWESAMNIFVDKTGKHGPSSWEVGTYPNGQEDFPVAGVSWYEASAYAVFADKKLPNVYQWSVLAETSRSMDIIPLSNFNGISTVRAGSMEGISSYGIYDLAGNVREWCYNGTDIRGESYILGGGWNDPIYSFNDAYTQPSIDRSITNGFRCVKDLPGDTTIDELSNPLKIEFRDYKKEKPVDNKTFNIFLRQYAYDKAPLNEELITMADTGIWRVEKVTLDAGYNNERLIVYLFLPRDAKPPFQPVVYFPGSTGIHMDMFTSNNVQFLDWIVKSGRVLIYPILKGTFERKDELSSDMAEETVFYKDHVIMWRKDFGRTIDYLETRSDILADKIGFFGWSWGGFMGGIIPAVEKRIKAVVLNVGGMAMENAFPEVDQINFLPRITQPVLMLNGKYDAYIPVETCQKPMFDFLGTPAKDKKIIIYDTGHSVPKTELIKEALYWFDKYLGLVK